MSVSKRKGGLERVDVDKTRYSLKKKVKRRKSNDRFFRTILLFMKISRRMERGLADFFKKGRTKIFLEIIRNHSAKLVIVFATILVAVGNYNPEDRRGGFLVDLFRKEVTNEEKIRQRIEDDFESKNISMLPLVSASNGEGKDEDLVKKMLGDEDLAKNQMQYQVLTATEPDAQELLKNGADVAVYEVQDGDSVSVIAQKFSVTVNTILWANDISDADAIMPGDKIFILPVTGVRHVVKSGDNISSIAKKYEADEKKIISFNELPADGTLTIGDELVIPDGKIEQPRTTTPDGLLDRRSYYASSEREPSIIDKNPKGGHLFPYGYCTWYVAQYKYVPWGGHAGTWLYHAKAYGAKTGKTPKVGSILVTSESWYGHVAIVTKVSGSTITVKEMNYKGFAVESTRTLSANSRVIKGYIY